MTLGETGVCRCSGPTDTLGGGETEHNYYVLAASTVFDDSEQLIELFQLDDRS